MAFLTIVVILPLIILILQTFMMEQGKFSLDNFTLHYWLGEEFSKPTVYEGEAGILRAWHAGSLVSASSQNAARA